MPAWFGIRKRLALKGALLLSPLVGVLASDLPGRLLLAVPVGLACGASVWLLASVAVVRPLRRLAATASRLGTGDFTIRAEMPLTQDPDMRALADALNVMAERLAQRDTAIAAAQADLARSEHEMRMLADNSSDIIVRLDRELHRVYVSPAAQTILGTSPQEMMTRDILDGVHPDDMERMRTLLARVRHGAPVMEVTYRRERDNGRYVWLEAIWRRLDGDDGWVVVMRDVTRRRRTEDWVNDSNRKLRTLATQDGLTGLANRRHFDEVLESEFSRARRDVRPLGLVLVDVDRFKSFNDQYGHPAGDACLRRVADTIRAALRSTGDVAARYGGEEIGIILPGANVHEAGLVAERIRSAVKAMAIPHHDGVEGLVTISAGVATQDTAHDLACAADLVNAADRALYGAKQAGRDVVRISGQSLMA
jgi:diguanylate cyclase (GGDEF)-like protein/PAS domain S-box-containing protein